MKGKVKSPSGWRHPEHVAWRRVGEEVVILDLKSSEYFSLNETGGLVWEKMGEGMDLEAIRAELCAAFDVDSERAGADIRRIIDALSKRKLLTSAGR